jgi:hypothetical protein
MLVPYCFSPKLRPPTSLLQLTPTSSNAIHKRSWLRETVLALGAPDADAATGEGDLNIPWRSASRYGKPQLRNGYTHFLTEPR